MNKFFYLCIAVLLALASPARAEYYAQPIMFSMPHDTKGTESFAALPTRFGHLTVSGARSKGSYFYTVAINGTAIAAAPYQSYRMVVSDVYKLVDEDVVIFTVDGDANGCTAHNFMVVLRSNGTFVQPAEIGDCRTGYQARIIDNGLVVEFGETRYANRPAIWRYKYGALERI